ncbi:MAG TPA: cobalamin B12-binding domain-containing protein [Candidatus Hydrogenedentes bacterium]|nr:cobalamin B12-binding domain-containing protein [Candidatus Hydrogenedentota bacterium]
MTVKKVLGAAIGQCVHVAGMDHFLQVCERNGWQAISLGPAVPLDRLLEAVRKEEPDLVAVSYRLTADDAVPLLEQLADAVKTARSGSIRWVFGGTPPVAEKARAFNLFERIFDGTEPAEAVEAYIQGQTPAASAANYADDLISRIHETYPFPLIRHHYGEPEVKRTIRGAGKIARAGVLDVLSIGPDQNAQEHFFHPDEMDPAHDGAGGVAVRSPKNLASLYKATRCGNYPLLRCYSGTRDLIRWAEMCIDTIHIAWGAIPLCWYSVMDGRSKAPFPEAIVEKQAAMRFYAERGIPVEVNESHQWSLRDAHDALAVATAFLAAYNAKKQGVKHYVIQMMHNTPPSTSPIMDLAKMLAKLDLIKQLEGPDFVTYREVRAGITSLPPDPDEAKGHMAASAVYSMALKPHILHVVGFTEASHVVNPDVLIESCRIARGAARLALKGAPDPVTDPNVLRRKEVLKFEADTLLRAIKLLGPDSEDPWSDPAVLTRAIQQGVLDTPHFRGNPHVCGNIMTACINGGWDAVDPETRKPMTESERLSKLGINV